MSDVISRNFQLDDEIRLDESTLHQALTSRIAEMLDFQADLLFSTLYRLDVLEHKIKSVMAGTTGEEIAAGLARLVIERQKEKSITRKNSNSTPHFKDF